MPLQVVTLKCKKIKSFSALKIHPPASPSVTTPFQKASGLLASRLRILATSDLHAHLRSWDYLKNRASPAVGLARTASLIAKARSEVSCCLLVDNGDFLQGSPLGDVEALQTPDGSGVEHPMIAAMNLLGYDAVNLGNHEFSHGLDFLLCHLARAQFPVISANLVHHLGTRPLNDARLVAPSVIVTRLLADESGQMHPLRVGFVGFAPPQTAEWEGAKLGRHLQGRDILDAAKFHVPRLRAQGADVVIALSHSGIGAPTPTPWMENATAALAQMDGIDALVAGHTHQNFPPPDTPAACRLLFGKPAVMPGFYGSHLGVIDLDLIWAEERWQITSGQSTLRPISRRTAKGGLLALVANAPAIVQASASAHRATRAWANRPVGHTACALHSYFAMVAPSAVQRLVARAQAAHVARALRDGPHSGLPVLSAAAPFHAGGRGGPDNYVDIPPGPLKLRHIYDLYPHPNVTAALRVTGADLHLWLERSFSQFRQIAPCSQDVPLLDEDFPSFNFDTVDGLTWAVDLAAPPWVDARGTVLGTQPPRRIRDLSFQGKPLDPDQPFVLATNSYRASGSGGFVSDHITDLRLDPESSSRDVLASYVAQNAPLSDTAPPNWHFVPMPGTSVWFDSAPNAERHLSGLARYRAQPLWLTPQGFRRFRLHL